MSKRSKASLIIGGLVLLASIVIYAIIRPPVFPSTIVGLGFLLYSEVVLFGGFLLMDFCGMKSSKLLLWSGAGVSLGIYAFVVFISSLVFINAHTAAVQGFWVFQIVLLAAALVICFIIGSFSIGAKERDEKTLEAGRTVQYAIDQLTLVKEQTDKKTAVDKLIDGLRFSDTSVTVDADVEINDTIMDLQKLVQSEEMDEDGFLKTVQSIEFLIKKRNLQTRVSKQGSI